MKKYTSAYKLPSVHFNNQVQIPEDSSFNSPITYKLKLLEKYQYSLSKSRTRSRSQIEFPIINKDHKQQAQTRRRKSKMAVIEMYKKDELEDEKRFVGSMEQRYTKQYKEYRKKHYRPEKIKQALQKIREHKVNIDQIGCETLKQKCYNLAKYSVFNDPLLQFYKGQLASILVLDQIFNSSPIRYDIAQQIMMFEQKVNLLMINYKQKEMNDMVQNINKHEGANHDLRHKLILLSRRTKTQGEQVKKSLQISNTQNLIRGFRLQQQNIAERIKKNEKQLGKFIKNGFLMSEAMIITKKYEMLKKAHMKTQPNQY